MITRRCGWVVGSLLGITLMSSTVLAQTLTVQPLVPDTDPNFSDEDAENPGREVMTLKEGGVWVFRGYRTVLDGTLTYDYEAVSPGMYVITIAWFNLDSAGGLKLYIDGSLKRHVVSARDDSGGTLNEELQLSAGTHQIKIESVEDDGLRSFFLYYLDVELVSLSKFFGLSLIAAAEPGSSPNLSEETVAA